jgi:energy-coupling factor transporter transmembrane protein EcfT
VTAPARRPVGIPRRALGPRVAWTLGLAAAAALARTPWMLGALAALATLGFLAAGRGDALRRVLGPAVGLAGFAFAVNVIAAWISPRGPLGGVGSAEAGAAVGAWTGGRLFVTALAFGALAHTTRPGHALDALSAGPLRRLGRAGESAMIVALLALRFGPLAAAEARRLARAVALRVQRRPGLWAAPAVAVPLVLAAVRRADRLALVLEARHFGAAPRTVPLLPRWSAADRALAAAGLALPAAAAWLPWG